MANPPVNSTDSPSSALNSGAMDLGTSEPGFLRTEALLDIQRFKDEYLFGIPLQSSLTGQTVSDTTLKNFIMKGVSEAELNLRIPISPIQKSEPFDYIRSDDWLNFGFRRLSYRPVLKILQLSAYYPGIDPNDPNPPVFPTDWCQVESTSGVLRIVPISSSAMNDAASFSMGVYRMLWSGTMQQWPNFWNVTYLAGVDFDKVPAILNDYIGICAAIKFLSIMGPVLFPANSYSVSMDGMAQATGTAGPQFLAQRVQELQTQKDALTIQLKAQYGTDINLTVAG